MINVNKAIKILVECDKKPTWKITSGMIKEAQKVAVAALRDQTTLGGCEKCKDPSMSIWIGHYYAYCPYCGKPQNEQAWVELVMRFITFAVTLLPNASLTLGELREMHNTPVWVVLDREGVNRVANYGIVDSECECVKGLTYLLRFEDYGEWVAYRRKPFE